MKAEIKIVKDGRESLTIRGTRYEFHHFKVNMGPVSSNATLIRAVIGGKPSKWLAIGLDAYNGFGRGASTLAINLAKDMAVHPDIKERIEIINF